jgi:hypothetical protein
MATTTRTLSLSLVMAQAALTQSLQLSPQEQLQVNLASLRRAEEGDTLALGLSKKQGEERMYFEGIYMVVGREVTKGSKGGTRLTVQGISDSSDVQVLEFTASSISGRVIFARRVSAGTNERDPNATPRPRKNKTAEKPAKEKVLSFAERLALSEDGVAIVPTHKEEVPAGMSDDSDGGNEENSEPELTE